MKKLAEACGNRSAVLTIIVTTVAIALVGCGGSTPAEPTDAGGALELDENGKTPICHYQQDIGTWTLTRLSLEAALEHLAKHDDAVPGGTTTITKTRLDLQCRRVT
jgi:hypothetical protein